MLYLRTCWKNRDNEFSSTLTCLSRINPPRPRESAPSNPWVPIPTYRAARRFLPSREISLRFLRCRRRSSRRSHSAPKRDDADRSECRSKSRETSRWQSRSRWGSLLRRIDRRWISWVWEEEFKTVNWSSWVIDLNGIAGTVTGENSLKSKVFVYQ